MFHLNPPRSVGSVSRSYISFMSCTHHKLFSQATCIIEVCVEPCISTLKVGEIPSLPKSKDFPPSLYWGVSVSCHHYKTQLVLPLLKLGSNCVLLTITILRYAIPLIKLGRGRKMRWQSLIILYLGPCPYNGRWQSIWPRLGPSQWCKLRYMLYYSLGYNFILSLKPCTVMYKWVIISWILFYIPTPLRRLILKYRPRVLSLTPLLRMTSPFFCVPFSSMVHMQRRFHMKTHNRLNT